MKLTNLFLTITLLVVLSCAASQTSKDKDITKTPELKPVTELTYDVFSETEWRQLPDGYYYIFEGKSKSGNYYLSTYEAHDHKYNEASVDSLWSIEDGKVRIRTKESQGTLYNVYMSSNRFTMKLVEVGKSLEETKEKYEFLNTGYFEN